MTTTTLTLTEFLSARLDEDHADVIYRVGDEGGDPLADGPRTVRRALREVEAKRRIVALAQEAATSASTSGMYAAAEDYLECVLREVASAYADHPDYRNEWCPDEWCP